MKRILTTLFVLFLFAMIYLALSTPTIIHNGKPHVIDGNDTVRVFTTVR